MTVLTGALVIGHLGAADARSHLSEWTPVVVPDRANRRIVVGVILGCVLFIAFLGVGLPLIRTSQEDPIAECAKKYDQRKADLTSADWSWLPPGWTCSFADGPSGRVP